MFLKEGEMSKKIWRWGGKKKKLAEELGKSIEAPES
jgi:hypothetical protein